jgi:hypothetical protein
MAHPSLHLLGPNFSPDAFPFGPNSPDLPLSPSKLLLLLLVIHSDQTA